jgi:hypothetical protein
MISEWIRMAGLRDIVLRSLRVSAIVGTALVAINQGDLFLAGGLARIFHEWKRQPGRRMSLHFDTRQ